MQTNGLIPTTQFPRLKKEQGATSRKKALWKFIMAHLDSKV